MARPGEWVCLYICPKRENTKFIGTMDCDVPAFKGARKITSLNVYPLTFHRNEPKLRAELIERGKKFVSLQGVNYKSHEGLAYYKKRKQIIKVNINGRIMVDPAIHRRILPNYNVSTVKPNDPDILDSDSDDDSDDDDCGCKDRLVPPSASVTSANLILVLMKGKVGALRSVGDETKRTTSRK